MPFPPHISIFSLLLRIDVIKQANDTSDDLFFIQVSQKC